MKKFLKYMFMAGFAVVTAACSNDTTEDVGTPDGEMAHLQLSYALASATRAEGYDALSRSTLRIYKKEAATEGTDPVYTLIRKYYPASETPADIYLIAGDYKVSVEAGDKSEATFENKTYYGEQEFTLVAKEPKTVSVSCKMTNIAVRVVYDQTILDKMDKSYVTYVSAADEFSKTEAENNSVPTLKYEKDTTGFFLLPADVSNLSWGFYGESTELGSVTKINAIKNPVAGNQYTLTYKYSKTPDGFLSVSVVVREYEEKYNDEFIFSPQPTLSGDGFNIDEAVGYFDSPVQFKLSSIDAIASMTMTANGVDYPILTNGNAIDGNPAKGITYTPTDAYTGTLALDAAFFANLPAGINTLSFVMRDSGGVEGDAMGHVAIQGLNPMQNIDLWNNSATLSAVVTDPSITDVKISYRVSGGEWKEVAATKSSNCVYTAAIAPEWSESKNAKGYTVYTPDTATGIWAGHTYEYNATIGSTTTATLTETTGTGNTLPTLNNSGLSCYTSDNTSESNFWGSGNNTFTGSLCTYDSATQGAKLQATDAFSILASGNLFSGTFNFGGITTRKGTVGFGNKYTYTARPSAFTFTYSANIGTVNIVSGNTIPGVTLNSGDPDKASIYVAIIDWGARHSVTSGTGAPSGVWSVEDGADAVSEGKIIGYAVIYPQGTVSETNESLQLFYYDKTAKPTSGNYTLAIGCSTSAYGDYMTGSNSSSLYIRNFGWKY